MNKRFLHILQFSLIGLDFLCINTIYVISDFLFRTNGLLANDIQYAYFIVMLNGGWIALSLLQNIYSEKNIVSFELFTKATAKAFFYYALILVMCLFFFHFLMLSRMFIMVVMVSIALMLLVNRFIYLVINHYFRRRDWLIDKVVILGYNPLSKRLVSYLTEEGFNKKIVGYCEEFENVHELSSYPIISDIEGAMEACKKHGVSEIYSTIAPEHNNSLYQLIQTADENCVRFKIVPDLEFFFKKQMHIDYLKEIPVISLRKEPLEDLGNRIKKRIFDIIISFLVCVLILSWLVPLISILIFFESRGPIFFTQLRTGKDNKTFRCLKFRSMRTSKDADTLQATKLDGRITRVGNFLRKTSLDEFPQFFNVLTGDMSIVGPRPHMLRHTDEYSRLIGQYMVRQFLKPGITGWAQVNGFRGETKNVDQMQRRVDHDLWYLENWSIIFDLRIILMTAFHALRGDENAY